MNNMHTAVEARPPNWLPLPGGEKTGIAASVPQVDENDLFPKGEVLSFYPNQGMGFVRSKGGKTLSFSVKEIDLIGPKNSARYITAGSRVGFDYSHTSHGLRITRLKVY